MSYLITLIFGLISYLYVIEKIKQKDKIPFTDLLSKL